MACRIDASLSQNRQKQMQHLLIFGKIACDFHPNPRYLRISDKLRYIILRIGIFLLQNLNGTAKLRNGGGVFLRGGILPQNLADGGNAHVHLVMQA